MVFISLMFAKRTGFKDLQAYLAYIPKFLYSLYAKNHRPVNPFLWLVSMIETDVLFLIFQIIFTRVDCVGNETNLFSCNMQLHKDQCTHAEDAGVRCHAPLVNDLKVRSLFFLSFI